MKTSTFFLYNYEFHQEAVFCFFPPEMTLLLLRFCSCFGGTDNVKHENEMDLFEAIDVNVSSTK